MRRPAQRQRGRIRDDERAGQEARSLVSALLARMELPGTLADAVAADPFLSELQETGVTLGFNADLVGCTTEGRTLFAPQDTGFAEVADVVGGMVPAREYDVLQDHMRPDTLIGEEVLGLKALGTGEGPDISFAAADGAEDGAEGVVLKAGQARVVGTDLRTNNGVLRVIDGALLPLDIDGRTPTE